jgi:hypothetical protein
MKHGDMKSEYGGMKGLNGDLLNIKGKNIGIKKFKSEMKWLNGDLLNIKGEISVSKS